MRSPRRGVRSRAPSSASSGACPSTARSSPPIAARDPERARDAMREHLLTVERYLAEYAAGGAAEPEQERAS